MSKLDYDPTIKDYYSKVSNNKKVIKPKTIAGSKFDLGGSDNSYIAKMPSYDTDTRSLAAFIFDICMTGAFYKYTSENAWQKTLGFLMSHLYPAQSVFFGKLLYRVYSIDHIKQ